MVTSTLGFDTSWVELSRAWQILTALRNSKENNNIIRLNSSLENVFNIKNSWPYQLGVDDFHNSFVLKEKRISGNISLARTRCSACPALMRFIIAVRTISILPPVFGRKNTSPAWLLAGQVDSLKTYWMVPRYERHARFKVLWWFLWRSTRAINGQGGQERGRRVNLN